MRSPVLIAEENYPLLFLSDVTARDEVRLKPTNVELRPFGVKKP